MSDKPTIEVKGISKSYKITGEGPKNQHPTVKDDLVNIAKAPLRLLGSTHAQHKTDFWALKDINFEVAQGDVVGLMGKNGSGKSTLFKILSRITQPTEGEAILRGKTASLLEVGTGFHPELSGRENVYLNGSILGMKKAEIEKKFDDIVAFSEIPKFIDTPVKFYSSGMKVRLAFSVAVHLEAEILIIDEVLAVGDLRFKQKSIERMRQIAASGKTILFVSHIVRHVKRICNRGIVLKDGQIVMDDMVDPAIEQYLELLDLDDNLKNEAANEDGASVDNSSMEVEAKLVSAESSISGSTPDAEIIVELKNTLDKTLDDLRMILRINNQLGKTVAVLVSDIVGQKLSLKPNETKNIRVKLDQLPVVPDVYNLALVVRDKPENGKKYAIEKNLGVLKVPEFETGYVDINDDSLTNSLLINYTYDTD